MHPQAETGFHVHVDFYRFHGAAMDRLHEFLRNIGADRDQPQVHVGPPFADPFEIVMVITSVAAKIEPFFFHLENISVPKRPVLVKEGAA